ncbi:hypothetical protein ACFQWA_11900 [Streptomyces thermogriseus]
MASASEADQACSGCERRVDISKAAVLCSMSMLMSRCPTPGAGLL